MMILIRILRLSAFFLVLLVLVGAAWSAYKGHANDSDVNAILGAYPDLKNTAVDACATCHKSGEVSDAGERRGVRDENHCGYCHAVYVKDKRDIRETLNRYGADYRAAGRGLEAVKTLAQNDSDQDGFSNEVEFFKGTNPGDLTSNPSARIAPYRIYTSAEIGRLVPAISQTVFLNTSHNKAGDFYNTYRGYRVYKMLQAAGISDGATSVDFISLDGFVGTFTIDELKRSWPQGTPVMGLSKKDIGPCGWVNYNVPGLDSKKALPNASIVLAFEENGKKIEAARMDPESGKISGTGPLRLVVPQARVSPPDVPMYAEKSCQEAAAPENRFNDNYDHNGGRSSFSIVAIKVKPLSEGTRDFEWEKVRDQFVAGEKVVIFGSLESSENR